MAEKILVTSALPYVNNVPHLGNLIGSLLSADVFARFKRLQGKEVLFVCGTDEHGTATEIKALQEGKTPREIVDKYFEIHKKIYKAFNLSFDCFGRTSTEEHKKLTQEIFLKLYENGFIAEKELEEFYCSKCKIALADRYIEGTCPYCGYEHAKGDQCENCGKLLNPSELIDARCSICNSKPEVIKAKHLFLDLNKLQDEVEEWFKKQSKEGFWTWNAIKITENWLKEGLKERCITRDLRWGIPVPLKGYENKVFYVWFDAPIGYISITKACREDWKDFWQEKVKLYQFMGKDNVPFHSIFFPAMLIGTRQGWNLVYHINSTEYLNYEGGQFSKSKGIGVFCDDAINSGIDIDVWRYYLIVNRPEQADTDFLWNDFKEKNNNELVANLGNFIYRVTSFINRHFNGIVSSFNVEEFKKEIEEINKELKELTELFERVKLKDALRKLMHISSLANKYFQQAEPWKLVKENKGKAAEVLSFFCQLTYLLACNIQPFMPETSSRILRMLNVDKVKWVDKFEIFIDNGHKINKEEILFKKLEDDFINELREKFSGKKVMPLSLKVGRIINVEDIKGYDKLYKLEVDLGKEKRVLVAGLKKYYSKEELRGKNIVVLCNLKAAKFAGITSQGMLLAAEDNGKVSLLSIDDEPGKEIFASGYEISKEEITIKDFEKLKLFVKDGKAYFNDALLRTDKAEVYCKLEKGVIK